MIIFNLELIMDYISNEQNVETSHNLSEIYDTKICQSSNDINFYKQKNIELNKAISEILKHNDI